MKHIILILLIVNIYAKLNKEDVEIAINCGGEEYKTKTGVTYQKDNYYDGGEISDFGKTFDIKNTKDVEIYQTERWSQKDLVYKIPLKKQGKFVLVLKFSEVYFNNKGEKIFDVKLGDKKIVQDLDIYEKVGKASAYDEYIQFEVKNNNVYIDNKLINDAYKDGKIILTFAKSEADNPKINAILVVKGTLQDTDYFEYLSMVENQEKMKVEKDRKNREFQRMSKTIDYEDFEDDFVDDPHKYALKGGIVNKNNFLFLIVGAIFLYIFFGKKKKHH